MNGIVSGKIESATPSSGKEMSEMFLNWTKKSVDNWPQKISIAKTGNKTYAYPLFRQSITGTQKFAMFAEASYGTPFCQFYCEFYGTSDNLWRDNFSIHYYSDATGVYKEQYFVPNISANEIGASFSSSGTSFTAASLFDCFILRIE